MNIFGIEIKFKGNNPNGDKYNKELCDERHTRIDKALECIPIIKETVARIDQKIEDFLDGNGKDK